METDGKWNKNNLHLLCTSTATTLCRHSLLCEFGYEYEFEYTQHYVFEFVNGSVYIFDDDNVNERRRHYV